MKFPAYFKWIIFSILYFISSVCSFEIKVMSFNIKNGSNRNNGPKGWEARKQQVYNIFKDHTPDVVGLQEAFRYQLDEMGEALPEYAEIGVGRDDGLTAGEYSAIFYLKDKYTLDTTGDFWLSATPDVPGSIGEGADLPRICTWGRFLVNDNGSHFYFYNAHYSHISSGARLAGAKVIAQRIADRQHQQDSVIYACDCNSGETNDPMRYLFGELNSPIALKSSYRVLHSDEPNSLTFNGWSSNISGNPIDYILIPQIDVGVNSSVIIHDNNNGDYPSDHYPIMSAISLKDNNVSDVTDELLKSDSEFSLKLRWGGLSYTNLYLR